MLLKVRFITEYLILVVLIIKNVLCQPEQSTVSDECVDAYNGLNSSSLRNLFNQIIPKLQGTRKGDSGRIAVIGGSEEYTGAPYFTAISALKTGADLVYVITTPTAAPVIKSYSPELIVYPYLSKEYAYKIPPLLPTFEVIVIGPGLGKHKDELEIVANIITNTRAQKKPLVIDADGLYLVSKNISLVKDYPPPGVILTPNHREIDRLLTAIKKSGLTGFQDLGAYTNVLAKGQYDNFTSNAKDKHSVDWSLDLGGSPRRTGGQGDILAGVLATFFNWALKSDINICDSEAKKSLAASVASYGAVKLTRDCSAEAYKSFGRGMLALDMINIMHVPYTKLLDDVQL